MTLGVVPSRYGARVVGPGVRGEPATVLHRPSTMKMMPTTMEFHFHVST